MAKKIHKIEKIEVSNLKEFIEFIEKVSNSFDYPLWFRGTANTDYPLLPLIYRNNSPKTVREFLKIEKDIFSRFKQVSIPYLEKDLSSDWEYMFFMQHHGIPTRLLDWTENPFIGLYFALKHHFMDLSSKKIKDENLAVWVLNPTLWNKDVLSGTSYPAEVLMVEDKGLSGYVPLCDYKILNEPAVAIHGIYNNKRIIAQRGAFTIFGKNVSPMEEQFTELSVKTGVLSKIEVSHSNAKALFKSILRVGYTESVIYPDLEGVSMELKRNFGYGEINV